MKGEKVVLVLGCLELGGAERQALLLAQHLQKQGAHVQVWGFNRPGRLAQLCEEYGIPWRVEPIQLPRQPVRLMVNLWHYSRKLRKERPDVIMAYTYRPNLVCGLVWRMTGARLFLWNQRDVGVEGRSRTLGRLAVRNTPHFVSNSLHGADYLVRTLKVDPKKVHVLHNGVELSRPRADRAGWRAQLGVSDRCVLACMVANLSSFKDHATLLKAWRIVLDRAAQNNGSLVLLLAGRFDQEYRPIQELSARLNLGETVRFLGQVDDVAGLLSAVDMGVFSSRSEGMPNGVLECMAAGLPVVATDIPGIREAVGAEGYGFLAPSGNAEVLAEKIMLLLESPERRAGLGAVNRNRILQEFNAARMCEQMVELIGQHV
jgi:glycosyltransferase involved in cell wall biosynthesis